MKNVILLIIIAFIFAGCASLKELRETPPTRTETYSGNYKDVANCVVDKIDASESLLPPRLRINEKGRKARIFRVFESSGDAAYEFEITQIDNARFVAESWGMATIGGREMLPNRIWPFFEKCTEK